MNKVEGPDISESYFTDHLPLSTTKPTELTMYCKVGQTPGARARARAARSQEDRVRALQILTV